LGKIKFFNFTKIGHILCNENKIVKKNNECIFELTLNLQKFYVNLTKKIFVNLFMTCNFKLLFLPFKFYFKNYNNVFEYIIE
jgi:hypothetical protein